MQCLAQFEVSLIENESNKTFKKIISSFLVKNIRNRCGKNNILIMIQNSEGYYTNFIFSTIVSGRSGWRKLGE